MFLFVPFRTSSRHLVRCHAHSALRVVSPRLSRGVTHRAAAQRSDRLTSSATCDRPRRDEATAATASERATKRVHRRARRRRHSGGTHQKATPETQVSPEQTLCLRLDAWKACHWELCSSLSSARRAAAAFCHWRIATGSLERSGAMMHIRHDTACDTSDRDLLCMCLCVSCSLCPPCASLRPSSPLA